LPATVCHEELRHPRGDLTLQVGVAIVGIRCLGEIPTDDPLVKGAFGR